LISITVDYTPRKKRIEARTDFWLKETEISSTTIDLYLAMEAILGENNTDWMQSAI